MLKEKNFTERLDSIYKLINIWSVRGLSIYGKVTIIKSFLIPKYIYVCSILSTPKKVLKELNKILFKFLSKLVDKVTRASVINEYEEGGLRMVDLECMVKSLRLAWLKRIFSGTNGTWKTATYNTYWAPLGDSSLFTATTISRITQFLLNFIGSYCYGGRDFVKCLPLKMIEKP